VTATARAPTQADEVVQIVIDLFDLVDARIKVCPVLALVFHTILLRLGRLRDGLARLAGRIRAGKPPRPRKPCPSAFDVSKGVFGASARVRNPVQWPTKYRALADMLGEEAAPFADRLRALLANREAVAFIAAHAEVGRYMRPLCRAFGVRLIRELRLPRRERAPRARWIIETSSAAPAPRPTPAAPPMPPPEIPVAATRTFTPSEGDPPMADRVARYLARTRAWRE
jgi:hypothetical protein